MRYDEHSNSQRLHKYTMIDETPRHTVKKYRLDNDEEEYKKALSDLSHKNPFTEQEIENAPLEQEYIHHPIYFRGLHLMPMLQGDRLAYFDEKDNRFKAVENIHIERNEDSD